MADVKYKGGYVDSDGQLVEWHVQSDRKLSNAKALLRGILKSATRGPFLHLLDDPSLSVNVLLNVPLGSSQVCMAG
jgi:transposase-like protein